MGPQRMLTRALLRRTYSTAPAVPPTEQHDLLILGGGPVGLSLLAALAASPLLAPSRSLTLLEAQSLDPVRTWAPPPHEWSNRVSSVTHANLLWLQQVGIAKHLRRERLNELHTLSITSSPSSTPLTFSSSASPLSTMVENVHLQHAALKSVEGKDGVEVVDARKVVAIERGDGGWPVVTLSGKDGDAGRRLRGRLLIGADGPNSPAKHFAGIESFGWPYEHMHGLVGTVDIAASELDDSREWATAYQRFLPTGPIALLPLSRTTSSFVWSTTPAQIAHLKSLPLSDVPALLNAALSPPSASPSSFSPSPFPDDTAPHILSVHPSSLASFPLRLSHASSYLADRVALLGDAAHSIHPLAGQGLNLGLSDAAALLSTLSRSAALGLDLGSLPALREYPRAVYTKNHLMLSACDHLASVFASSNPALQWGRENAMEVLQELDPVKRALMAFAGSAGVREGRRESPLWEGVASAVEGAGKAREIVGFLGGVVARRLGLVA